MTLARSVLGIVPGLQATALVAHNIPKDFGMKPSRGLGMKKPIKRIVRTGVGTIIGVGLIRPTASMINLIP